MGLDHYLDRYLFWQPCSCVKITFLKQNTFLKQKLISLCLENITYEIFELICQSFYITLHGSDVKVTLDLIFYY